MFLIFKTVQIQQQVSKTTIRLLVLNTVAPGDPIRGRLPDLIQIQLQAFVLNPVMTQVNMVTLFTANKTKTSFQTSICPTTIIVLVKIKDRTAVHLIYTKINSSVSLKLK